MITNYEQFLVENLIYKAINESVFNFTDKFKDILKKIDSPIATELLETEQKDVPVSSNFLDLDGKETLSFISDVKAQRLLEDPAKKSVFKLRDPEWQLDADHFLVNGSLDKVKEIVSKFGDPDQIIKEKIGGTPQPDEFGEKVGEYEFRPLSYLAFRNLNLGRTRYIPNLVILKFGDKFIITDKSNITEQPAPYYKNRQTIRVGRGIRAILTSLGKKFTDAEIEDFVNKWKAAYDMLNNEFRFFDVVNGDDIAHFYYYENYELGLKKGTLSNSCMCKKPDSFFEIYTANPEVCSLVILRSSENKNLIKGRALLWKLKSGELFMDRVYTHFDSDFAFFYRYAEHNGWLRKKSNNSSSSEDLINPNGETIGSFNMRVEIKKIDYNKYPYLDTLCYLSGYYNRLELTNTEEGAEWELTSTGGTRESLECSTCGGSGEISCPNCEGSGEATSECGDCDGSGEVRCEDCTRGKVDCETCSGSGEVEDKEGDIEECKDCSGFGQVDCSACYKGWITCSSCNGDGTIEDRCTGCRGRGYTSCPDC